MELVCGRKRLFSHPAGGGQISDLNPLGAEFLDRAYNISFPVRKPMGTADGTEWN